MTQHTHDLGEPALGESAAGRRPAVSAGSARSLLLTVLGELVLPADRPVWTSSLLHVLTGIGLEEVTARQAIARGAAAGWMEGHKHGREVLWELTDAGRGLIEDGARRVYSMSATPPPWDGTWLALVVTIPQSQRVVRKKLYAALSWAGFGNPTPGLWLSPHREREAEVRAVIENLGLRGSTLAFTGATASVGLSHDEIVRQAWDLEDVAAHYEDLIARFADLDPAPGDPTLFTHVELVNQWQRFPYLDPQLPDELLPGWIGRRAAALCTDLRGQWARAAHARWAEVAGAPGPPIA